MCRQRWDDLRDADLLAAVADRLLTSSSTELPDRRHSSAAAPCSCTRSGCAPPPWTRCATSTPASSTHWTGRATPPSRCHGSGRAGGPADDGPATGRACHCLGGAGGRDPRRAGRGEGVRRAGEAPAGRGGVGRVRRTARRRSCCCRSWPGAWTPTRSARRPCSRPPQQPRIPRCPPGPSRSPSWSHSGWRLPGSSARCPFWSTRSCPRSTCSAGRPSRARPTWTWAGAASGGHRHRAGPARALRAFAGDQPARGCRASARLRRLPRRDPAGRSRATLRRQRHPPARHRAGATRPAGPSGWTDPPAGSLDLA